MVRRGELHAAAARGRGVSPEASAGFRRWGHRLMLAAGAVFGLVLAMGLANPPGGVPVWAPAVAYAAVPAGAGLGSYLAALVTGRGGA